MTERTARVTTENGDGLAGLIPERAELTQVCRLIQRLGIISFAQTFVLLVPRTAVVMNESSERSTST